VFTHPELIEVTPRLERFAFRLTRNTADAADLLQSTLLRGLEKKHLFQEGTNLFSWLSKVMYNMFASNYNRKVKFESQYDPEPYIEKKSVPANQDFEIELQDVGIAMETLTNEHRDILIMICVKGMKYAEVSEALDIPVGTVRSRLSRARDNLQSAISEPKHDPSASNASKAYQSTLMAA